ncbi:G-protein coupled receptor moody-like [Limulus polyphemus]|uniref:G-protein coupled receptor moody-like n=1 Tax=Limulus polyphemus TaxID=6850 RepID=A0ABM1BFD9_LIMPO|nr:G-protein coupled receptor moody-like [Limulus polyphemus]
MTTTEFLSLNFTTENDTEAHYVSDTFMSPMLKRKAVLHFATLCVIVLSIVGMCGNLLTTVALVKCPRVRSATAVFIVSLSISDFLYNAVSFPFSASDYILQKWIYGDALCVFYPFTQYLNGGLSLLFVTAIAINRYVLIAHQGLYEKIYQKRNIAMMIVGICLFAFIMLLPTLIGAWGRFGYDKNILTCTILEVDGRSSKAFLFIFGFVIPCITIVVCYARIFCVVKKSSSRIKMYKTVETKEKKSARDSKRREEEWRVTRMVLIIFCCFLICYLPNTIVKVIDKQNKYPVLHILVYILIYASASINPIIYGVTNKQYRQAYKTVLMCRRPRRPSFSSTPNEHPANKSSTSQCLKEDSVVVQA